MTIPLIVLAVFAALGGVLNLPFSHSTEFLSDWLEPVVGSHDTGDVPLLLLACAAVVMALCGIGAAVAVYLKGKADARSLELDAFAKGWWIDSTYAKFVDGPGRGAFNLIAWVDRTLVDGAVNGVAAGVGALSLGLRSAQTGKVRNYAIGIASGAVLMLLYVLVRMSN